MTPSILLLISLAHPVTTDSPPAQCQVTAPAQRTSCGQATRDKAIRSTTTLYVNLRGGDTIECTGTDDPGANTSGISNGKCGAWGPYGNENEIAEVMDVIRTMLAPYDIAVTDERPDHDDYSMMMLGKWDESAPGGGVAPLDCGDGNGRNVGFVNHWAADNWQADTHGRLVVHELGHALGLEHTAQDNAIVMSPTIFGGAEISKTCLNLVDSGGCAEHEAQCEPGQMNSHEELLVSVGGDGSDTDSGDESDSSSESTNTGDGDDSESSSDAETSTDGDESDTDESGTGADDDDDDDDDNDDDDDDDDDDDEEDTGDEDSEGKGDDGGSSTVEWTGDQSCQASADAKPLGTALLRLLL